jgi:thioredoxin-like negative regulator of GroEL
VQGLVKELGDGIAYVEVDASRDTATARQYQIQAVPTIILLDPSGEIVDTFVGTPGEGELRTAMQKAMGG